MTAPSVVAMTMPVRLTEIADRASDHLFRRAEIGVVLGGFGLVGLSAADNTLGTCLREICGVQDCLPTSELVSQVVKPAILLKPPELFHWTFTGLLVRAAVRAARTC